MRGSAILSDGTRRALEVHNNVFIADFARKQPLPADAAQEDCVVPTLTEARSPLGAGGLPSAPAGRLDGRGGGRVDVENYRCAYRRHGYAVTPLSLLEVGDG